MFTKTWYLGESYLYGGRSVKATTTFTYGRNQNELYRDYLKVISDPDARDAFDEVVDITHQEIIKFVKEAASNRGRYRAGVTVRKKLASWVKPLAESLKVIRDYIDEKQKRSSSISKGSGSNTNEQEAAEALEALLSVIVRALKMPDDVMSVIFGLQNLRSQYLEALLRASNAVGRIFKARQDQKGKIEKYLKYMEGRLNYSDKIVEELEKAYSNRVNLIEELDRKYEKEGEYYVAPLDPDQRQEFNRLMKELDDFEEDIEKYKQIFNESTKEAFERYQMVEGLIEKANEKAEAARQEAEEAEREIEAVEDEATGEEALPEVHSGDADIYDEDDEDAPTPTTPSSRPERLIDKPDPREAVFDIALKIAGQYRDFSNNIASNSSSIFSSYVSVTNRVWSAIDDHISSEKPNDYPSDFLGEDGVLLGDTDDPQAFFDQVEEFRKTFSDSHESIVKFFENIEENDEWGDGYKTLGEILDEILKPVSGYVPHKDFVSTLKGLVDALPSVQIEDLTPDVERANDGEYEAKIPVALSDGIYNSIEQYIEGLERLREAAQRAIKSRIDEVSEYWDSAQKEAKAIFSLQRDISQRKQEVRDELFGFDITDVSRERYSHIVEEFMIPHVKNYGVNNPIILQIDITKNKDIVRKVQSMKGFKSIRRKPTGAEMAFRSYMKNVYGIDVDISSPVETAKRFGSQNRGISKMTNNAKLMYSALPSEESKEAFDAAHKIVTKEVLSFIQDAYGLQARFRVSKDIRPIFKKWLDEIEQFMATLVEEDEDKRRRSMTSKEKHKEYIDALAAFARTLRSVLEIHPEDLTLIFMATGLRTQFLDALADSAKELSIILNERKTFSEEEEDYKKYIERQIKKLDRFQENVEKLEIERLNIIEEIKREQSSGDKRNLKRLKESKLSIEEDRDALVALAYDAAEEVEETYNDWESVLGSLRDDAGRATSDIDKKDDIKRTQQEASTSPKPEQASASSGTSRRGPSRPTEPPSVTPTGGRVGRNVPPSSAPSSSGGGVVDRGRSGDYSRPSSSSFSERAATMASSIGWGGGDITNYLNAIDYWMNAAKNVQAAHDTIGANTDKFRQQVESKWGSVKKVLDGIIKETNTSESADIEQEYRRVLGKLDSVISDSNLYDVYSDARGRYTDPNSRVKMWMLRNVYPEKGFDYQEELKPQGDDSVEYFLDLRNYGYIPVQGWEWSGNREEKADKLATFVDGVKNMIMEEAEMAHQYMKSVVSEADSAQRQVLVDVVGPCMSDHDALRALRKEVEDSARKNFGDLLGDLLTVISQEPDADVNIVLLRYLNMSGKSTGKGYLIENLPEFGNFRQVESSIGQSGTKAFSFDGQARKGLSYYLGRRAKTIALQYAYQMYLKDMQRW